MSAAIALAAFGAVTVALALQLPLGTLRLPGSGFFPLVLGALLMGLAALHAVHLFLAKPAQPAAAAPQPRFDDARRRVLLFIGVVAFSIALLQPAGYVASTVILMVGLLRVFGVAWGPSTAIAAGSAIACYVLFVQWLRIPMPAGPLGF
jgi:hypothetical protein